MSHRTRSRRRALCGGLLLVAAALLAGTPTRAEETTADLVGASGVVTLANLHPDAERSKLYAANFQQSGLIPVCTKVEWLELGRKQLRFRVSETGREYQYVYHKAAGEPFEQHLLRFFGRRCPDAEIRRLGPLDRQGIREGRAMVGMTRRGVEIALGPPPRHVTPDPASASSWLYWRNRFNKFRIDFDESGRVSRIQD